MTIPSRSPTENDATILLQPAGGGNFNAILKGFGSTILATAAGEAAALTAGAAALSGAGWPANSMLRGRLVTDVTDRYPPAPLSSR
jgi:hypothetical protein